MIIPQKEEVIFKSPELDLTAATFPAQQKRVSIPSNGPIEMILVMLQLTVGATPLTNMVGYGLLNTLKKVTLTLNDGTGAYDAVNCSGPGLIMLADQEGLCMDPSTRRALSLSLANATQRTQLPPIQAGSIFRICYPIFCPHPALQEGLRLRSTIPSHRLKQDPLLTLDFAPAAEISSVGDPFTAANVEVIVIRRDMPNAVESRILETGGYIRWDIRESIYDLATSMTGVEKRFAIPGTGEYATLVGSMMKGNAVLTPGDLSAVAPVGSEPLWKLEAAGNSVRQWRMKGRQLLNNLNRATGPLWLPNFQGDALNGISNLGVTSGAPPVWVTAESIVAPHEFGGALLAGLNVQEPAIFGFDFLTDNWGGAAELGSCLNANFPSDSIKWEIVGSVTTPANQTSSLSLIGRRYRDAIDQWKKFQLAA